MDWLKAAAMGLGGYAIILMMSLLALILNLPSGPMSVGGSVLNFFVVMFFAYYYFKWSGVGTKNDGLWLGALWVVTATALDALIWGIGVGRGSSFFTEPSVWVYNVERLALPLVFSRGIIEIKTTKSPAVV